MKPGYCAGVLLAVLLLLPPHAVQAGIKPAQVHSFEVREPRKLEFLHHHARAFVSVKARAGYTLDAGQPPTAWFYIRYHGRVVMAVENTPAALIIRLPAGVELLAPDVLLLMDIYRQWLEFDDSAAGSG